MLESEKRFIEDLNSKFHNEYIDPEFMAKAIEQRKTEERQEQQRKAEEAMKISKLKRYQTGQLNEYERKKTVDGLRSMLPQINEQMRAQATKDAAFIDRINGVEPRQKAIENLDKLIEITRDREKYINTRLNDAIVQQNKELLEEYTQEKEDVKKTLDSYIKQYDTLCAEE